MSAEIKTENIDLRGQNVLLVSVRGGENAIGTFTMGENPRENNTGAISRLLYVGTEPVINMTCPNGANKRSDKRMSLCSGYHGYERKLYDVISACFSRINQGDSLASGLKGIFGLLQDGVYVVYTSEYYPTEGSGVFFWGGYNTYHEIRGSAEHNGNIGSGNQFKPCYLMPTQSLEYFTEKELRSAEKEVNSRRIQGIAYHVSGFYSALLKGHHGAVACTKNNIPFTCAVIEKICDPYTERIPAIVQPTQSEEAEAQDNTQAEAPKPAVQIVEREGITGFRSPSVKIPIEAFPRDMLNLIISTLSEYKPPHFNILAAKLDAVRKKMVTNNALPLEVLEKAEQMPDVSMVESAYAISSISDEELNCLLAGDVECNGRVIISPNFYASIVTACNYLQYTDMKRFIDFSIAIMDNPELSATHEYVAQRVSSQEKNTKLYNFFKSAKESGEAKYEKIMSAANTFITRFDKAAKR
ncbi:MAG: hypothetical protein J1F03_08700 [Oscillospiraceae bacterium]|nr:hypothetical protein [Oscillospiraceae bacterium]